MSVPAADEPRPDRWQELTKAECFELLATEHLGRVAVVDDRQGLLGAGVAAEADRLLGVIGARVSTGQTGVAWQRATLAAAERGRSRDQALAVMFDRYLSCASTGEPVHAWPRGWD
jgi:hypothetical protein